MGDHCVMDLVTIPRAAPVNYMELTQKELKSGSHWGPPDDVV